MGYKRISFALPTVLALTLCMVLACSVGVSADIKLPALINDNMVLQQGRKVPVWGWAEPGEQIKVILSNGACSEKAIADETGRWIVKIDAGQAGGPYEMKISGKNSIVLKNVMVGEVWVASGQSNMELVVGNIGGHSMGVVNYEQEIAEANYPDIRLFIVKKKVAEQPLLDCMGRWDMCSSQTVPKFSAAAYFFGRYLHKKLNVPVGLIHASWGATFVEPWISQEIFKADPNYKPIIDRHNEQIANHPKAMEEYKQKLVKWKKDVAIAKAQGKELPHKPWPPYGPGDRNTPSGLYDGMIAPLIPYGIQGVIWYQGESNAERAYQYRKLFPDMIRNWRKNWNQGDFPFYYAQIAPWRYEGLHAEMAAELREAQLLTLSVPNTGMVVTTDISDTNDIHPRNKQDVGKRLALWALAKTYGHKGIVYSGPIYKSMKIEGDKIRLFFDYTDGGLLAKDGELTYFTIAGDDKQFVGANAVIEGDTIVVSSDKIKEPVAVRFAWIDTAMPNLFNGAGLPASLFRTDDWPAVSLGKE